MIRRSGFTLLELLVSILLMALVSLLVYGAVRAGRDSQARIADEHNSLQSTLAMRFLLETALAGAQATFLAPDTMFVVENRAGPRGVPQDRLTFVTSGDFPPLSPGADWIITLQPGLDGLRLDGRPMGIRAPTRLLARLPGVTGLAVRVLHPDVGPNWSDEWASPAVLPEAVELTYWTDSGRVGVPLTIALALGRVH